MNNNILEDIYKLLKSKKNITNVEKYCDLEYKNHISYKENGHIYIITIDSQQIL